MKREEAIKILQPIGEQYCEIANITLAPRMDEIAEAIDMAIDALKAQHSSEGITKDATSDLISRTETVKQLQGVFDVTVPITDYDGGFIDGIEFAISTASTMPIIQPQSTTGQLNDGAQSTARSTDLIDRQAAIDEIKSVYEWHDTVTMERLIEHINNLPTIQPVATDINVGNNSEFPNNSDTVSSQAAIDALDCINGVEEVLRSLPPAQPEPTYEQVEEYCKRRCLHVVTADFFESTKPQRLGHWILYDKRFPWRTWYKCSECGNYLDFSGVNGGRGEANYCPNCGAKMKGGAG